MNSPGNHSLLRSSALTLTLGCLLCTSQLLANEASIVEAKILPAGGERQFQIHVTLEHADTGWDHYANRWDVLDENGELLGSRTLHHPHVNEQPFTRSLSLTIPAGVCLLYTSDAADE